MCPIPLSPGKQKKVQWDLSGLYSLSPSSQPHLICPLCSFLPLPFLCLFLSSLLIKTSNPISFHIDHGTTVVFANSFYVPPASLINPFYCLVSLEIASGQGLPHGSDRHDALPSADPVLPGPCTLPQQSREILRASRSPVMLKSSKLCVEFAFAKWAGLVPWASPPGLVGSHVSRVT